MLAQLIQSINPTVPIRPDLALSNGCRGCGFILSAGGGGTCSSIAILLVDAAISDRSLVILTDRVSPRANLCVVTHGVAPSAIVVQPLAFTTSVSVEY